MTVESVTYITDLDDTNPASGDSRVEGDDHIRNIKTGILGTFSAFTGIPITVTEAEINGLDIATLGTVEASKVVTADINRMVKNILLDEATTFISDASDTTKQVKFEVSSAVTATVTTITASQTANRTLTLPNATDTLVGRDTTDTLTNKTLTSPTVNSPTITGGSISSSTTGVTQATANDSTLLATTAFVQNVKDTLPFSNSYESSSPTAITGSSTGYSEAHGFSQTPTLYKLYWKCTDAGGDNGYSQDDEICISDLFGYSGDSSVYADGTNVGLSSAANFNGLSAVIGAKSGGSGACDHTKWGWVVRAWY